MSTEEDTKPMLATLTSEFSDNKGRTLVVALDALGTGPNADLTVVLTNGAFSIETKVSLHQLVLALRGLEKASEYIYQYETNYKAKTQEEVDAANKFLIWLCESGEQQYWNWMDLRDEDKGVTIGRFKYEFDKLSVNLELSEE